MLDPAGDDELPSISGPAENSENTGYDRPIHKTQQIAHIVLELCLINTLSRAALLGTIKAAVVARPGSATRRISLTTTTLRVYLLETVSMITTQLRFGFLLGGQAGGIPTNRA